MLHFHSDVQTHAILPMVCTTCTRCPAAWLLGSAVTKGSPFASPLSPPAEVLQVEHLSPSVGRSLLTAPLENVGVLLKGGALVPLGTTAVNIALRN